MSQGNRNKCKNKQVGPNQFKSFCTVKETIKRKKKKRKGNLRNGENICNDATDGLIFKIHTAHTSVYQKTQSKHGQKT